MAINYDDVLGQLREAGLLVDRLEVGALRRCQVTDDRSKEKRGWYHLHEIRLDGGDDAIVGSFGVWRGNENNAQKVELRKLEISKEQREAMRKRLAEDRKRVDAQRAVQAKRAAERAAAVWRRLSAEGDCDYLRRKGVGAHGVRFSTKGAMAVPMIDAAGRVQGLQIIRGAQRGGDVLEKQFWPAGLNPKAHFHLIGAPGSILLLAEGYATGASLHEATGLPVAVAFTAGNLHPVALALHKRYPGARILVCADDDDTQRCQQIECRQRVWVSDGPLCPHCGKEHRASNAGTTAASVAAMAVDGAWMVPAWPDAAERKRLWLQDGRKLNDFNDLHASEGLPAVRAQIEDRIRSMAWRAQPAPGARTAGQGGGAAAAPPRAGDPLRPIESLDELLERYALVYGQGGSVFDHQEHVMVATGDMRDLCVNRQLHRAWAEHPEKQIVRIDEVGFDPAGTDRAVTCNLWAGWPTVPRAGECSTLLDLLYHMCKADSRPDDLYQWVLRWLAYPIQHPGAKMKTTLVVHGPQGAGKNLFFEVVMAIYGRYGRIIDQAAIEDKFNDWASRKLFLIADEVIARSDLYHVKNKLKAFITGDWIRINPKNMAARDERNHVNLVFLSNESMPVILDEDDRRHAVIWTPAKLDRAFYDGVRAEIADGGAAALHHHLMHLDLGDFNEGTLPPMTDAKRELIDLSKDSPSRFMQAFESGDVDGFPARGAPALLAPCLSSDLYDLYTTWCQRVGLRALNQPRFANALMRKHKAVTHRKRYHLDMATKGPTAITWLPGGHDLPPGEGETHWLGERIEVFRGALKAYRAGEFGR